MNTLAITVSGTGTILEALLKHDLPIGLVLADRECRALHIARQHSAIRSVLLDRNAFVVRRCFDRTSFTNEAERIFATSSIEVVAMAGFMTMWSSQIFAGRFRHKILNTHPSLLPAFKGNNAVRDALAYGVKITGCTIHLATAELDTGPILAQAPVSVRASDTVDSLHERIKKVERKLYPQTLKEFLG